MLEVVEVGEVVVLVVEVGLVVVDVEVEDDVDDEEDELEDDVLPTVNATRNLSLSLYVPVARFRLSGDEQLAHVWPLLVEHCHVAPDASVENVNVGSVLLVACRTARTALALVLSANATIRPVNGTRNQNLRTQLPPRSDCELVCELNRVGRHGADRAEHLVIPSGREHDVL